MESLPTDIQRRLSMLLDVNAFSQMPNDEIRSLVSLCQNKTPRLEPENKERLLELIREVATHQTRKLEISQGIYELVERSVKRLDDMATIIESELSQSDQKEAGSTADAGQTPTKKGSEGRRPDEGRRSKSRRSDAADSDMDQEMYCYCHSRSYGEMIACDSLSCPIEWFHLGCTNLKTPPTGQWFCDSCSGSASFKTQE